MPADGRLTNINTAAMMEADEDRPCMEVPKAAMMLEKTVAQGDREK